MNVTYYKATRKTYNFVVTFSDDEMLGNAEATCEIKCALLVYSSELNTPSFIYESGEHYGPTPNLTSGPNDNETTIHRVDKLEFAYVGKGISDIVLNFNMSLISGLYKFDKIELKYPGDLSKGFLGATAKQIDEIVGHLLSQQGKLCVNCVWCHNKKISGFCDYEYKFNKNKST